jgi:pimeloyl-ACP methyl ester carboxylesterase
MSHTLSVVYTWTADDLRLQGMHYEPAQKEIGVILIHGMTGNFIDNVFGDILGHSLTRSGYGFIYGHNRGWGHINDLAKKSLKSDNSHEYTRHGAVYERFQSCPYDIDAWVKTVHDLGYKRLILIGHSLGCPKLIYWWSRRRPKNILGVVLASPADMVGLTVKGLSPDEYQALTQEAKNYVKQGKYSHFLSKMIDDYMFISAETYLDEMVKGCAADVLPNKVSVLTVPTLCLYGEYDSAVIKSPDEDLNILRSHAIHCPDFQTAIIKGANHTYENREQVLANTILKWIKTTA